MTYEGYLPMASRRWAPCGSSWVRRSAAPRCFSRRYWSSYGTTRAGSSFRPPKAVESGL